MITITAYSEPAPINPVSEPVQSYEPEENNEPSEFEKILAGLLGKQIADDASAGLQIAGISETETDVNADILVMEDSGAEKADLFGIKRKSEETEISSKDEIPEEQFSVLVSADRLINLTETVEGDESDFDGLLPLDEGFDFNAEISSAIDVDENAEAMQIVPAFADESLNAELDKKDRADLKIEKAQNLPVDNRSGEETALLKNKANVKETPTRLDEARAKSRKDRVTVEVQDMRTSGAETAKAATGRGAELRVNASAETRTPGDTAVKEMTLELRLPNQGQGTAPTTWEAKAGNAMESMLARELHQNFNGDIVRHASMALRDGGEGTIKIALKPESLGNVKIRLEMAENKITGIIVVESEEALNAFKKELTSLEQAFRDSGFADADLNLSLTADGRNEEGQKKEESSFQSQTAALRYEDAEYAVSLIDVFERRQGSVNMFA